jgi:hypothetical protein
MIWVGLAVGIVVGIALDTALAAFMEWRHYRHCDDG